MNDKPDLVTKDRPPTPSETRNHAVRTASIDFAIRSQCGQSYDSDGRIIYDPDKMVLAATKFEAFIRGLDDKPNATIVKSVTIEALKQEPKKEGW